MCCAPHDTSVTQRLASVKETVCRMKGSATVRFEVGSAKRLIEAWALCELAQ